MSKFIPTAKGRFVVIFNQDHIRAFGTGYRPVYIEEGRKWVYMLDWATGDTARVKLSVLDATIASHTSINPLPRLKKLKAGKARAKRSVRLFRNAIESARAAT